MTGCAWKTGLLTGSSAAIAAGASSALGFATVPTAVLVGGTAATVSALSAGQPASSEIIAETVVHEAPETLWSVAQSAVEIGGIGLILFFVVPALVGWLLPGPTKLNRDKK